MQLNSVEGNTSWRTPEGDGNTLTPNSRRVAPEFEEGQVWDTDTILWEEQGRNNCSGGRLAEAPIAGGVENKQEISYACILIMLFE